MVQQIVLNMLLDIDQEVSSLKYQVLYIMLNQIIMNYCLLFLNCLFQKRLTMG